MTGFACVHCGASHEELPLCFVSREPLYAASIPEGERAERVRLSGEQCIVDDAHFFLLGNLDVPILGRAETLRWTVWSTLSEKSFERASELWDTPGREKEPPYFGWLGSVIPGYEHAVNLALAVHTQSVGTRPFFRLHPQDHPLYQDQVDGISWDRACELSHAAS